MLACTSHYVLHSITPPPPTSTLFPYTTLFRSVRPDQDEHRAEEQECGESEREHARGTLARAPPPVRGAPSRGRCILGRMHPVRSEEHTSELQSLRHLVCRLLLEKKT